MNRVGLAVTAVHTLLNGFARPNLSAVFPMLLVVSQHRLRLAVGGSSRIDVQQRLAVLPVDGVVLLRGLNPPSLHKGRCCNQDENFVKVVSPSGSLLLLLQQIWIEPQHTHR